MEKVILLMYSLVFFARAQAQEDTILVALEPLEISNNRLKVFSIGSKSISYDSLVLSQFKNKNLADLLSAESSMFIKSYGTGSLATSSFRGGNASQTAVLWNGFSLNSSMNGILDFSLIPSSFFNEISLQYGGETAQWGSGALGGSIHLNNKSSFGKGNVYSLGASLGSFGLNTQSVKTEISQEKMTFSLSLFRSQAKNNFPYFKAFNGNDSLVLQQHTDYLAFGLLTDLQYRIKHNKKIQVSVWYQNAHRNIPPILFQSSSTASQQDESTRMMVNYLWFKRRNKVKVKLGYFNETIGFQDSTAVIFADNNAKSLLSELSYDRELSKIFVVSSGLYNSYVFSETTNYGGKVDENRSSIYSFIKYKGENKKIFAVLSGRVTMIQSSLLTPTFSFQNTFKLNSFLQLKSKVSSVYRVPTLNDKYWNPGGNINLLPENGFSEEVGLALEMKDKANVGANSEITLFNKNINNWIAWVPSGTVWSPENIKKVWSRGMESLSDITFLKDDMKVSLKLLTNYVLSTNEQALSAGDNSFTKQLIYTPRYSGFVKLVLSKKQYSVSYRHNYTGYTFTTSDNSEYLSPFDVGAVHVSFNGIKGNYKFEGYFGIENIWGEEYVRIAFRPMPLINYSFGFNVNLYKPLNNKKS
ncbi:MAG: vitamin B12 transporter [Saprospiraceae bacterium]|jgi:vitamin B12 transporter